MLPVVVLRWWHARLHPRRSSPPVGRRQKRFVGNLEEFGGSTLSKASGYTTCLARNNSKTLFPNCEERRCGLPLSSYPQGSQAHPTTAGYAWRQQYYAGVSPITGFIRPSPLFVAKALAGTTGTSRAQQRNQLPAWLVVNFHQRNLEQQVDGIGCHVLVCLGQPTLHSSLHGCPAFTSRLWER